MEKAVGKQAVKSFFSWPPEGFVTIMPVKKVGVLSNYLHFVYVNKFCISCGEGLWKTPVENPVEIVEKSRFSTGNSGF